MCSIGGSSVAATAGGGHSSVPTTPMLAITKDNVQENKQQQALTINASP
jgi:hypothetical protein